MLILPVRTGRTKWVIQPSVNITQIYAVNYVELHCKRVLSSYLLRRTRITVWSFRIPPVFAAQRAVPRGKHATDPHSQSDFACRHGGRHRLRGDTGLRRSRLRAADGPALPGVPHRRP